MLQAICKCSVHHGSFTLPSKPVNYKVCNHICLLHPCLSSFDEGSRLSGKPFLSKCNYSTVQREKNLRVEQIFV